MMKVVILAGGFGTRLQEETEKIPKPMVTVGGIPILYHIIRNFADQGFEDFYIAGGYKVEQIRDWVTGNPGLKGLNVNVFDTGLATGTGGRVLRLKEQLDFQMMDARRRPFLLTYGDGLADVNFSMLRDHHLATDAMVTLTAVNPPSRFGRLRIEDGFCKIFTEKGQDPEGWINAGFYICQRDVIDLIPGDGCVWELDILPSLANQNRLAAFQHFGEFQMMDTWRDRLYLEELWEKGSPFWTRLSQ